MQKILFFLLFFLCFCASRLEASAQTAKSIFQTIPKETNTVKEITFVPSLDVIPSFLPKRCHFRSHKRKHQIVAHCASSMLLYCLLSSCNFRGRWTLACICKKNLHVLCPIACYYYLVLLTRTFLS